VFLDGREVILALVKARTDLSKLARDAVAFLSGQREGLSAKDYQLPWKLALLPWLALGIPFLAMWLRVPGGVSGGGRFLWFLMAGLAVFIGVRWMRSEALTTRRRFAVAASVLFGFGLVLAGALAYRLANPNTVPASAWVPFTPPGLPCSVLMPGVSHSSSVTQRHAGVESTRVYSVRYPPLNKRFQLTVGRIDQGQDFGFRRDKVQILRDRARDLQNELMAYGNSNKFETITLPSGEKALQVIVTVAGHNSRTGSVETHVTRLILDNDRLFTLSVVGEDVDDGDPDVKRFFDSFRLMPAFALPSPGDLPGVVAYWSFDDFGPGFKNILITEGVRGKAAAFNGNSSFIEVEGRNDLDFPARTPFTIVGWVRTSGVDRTVCILCMQDGRNRDGPCALNLSLGGGFLFAQRPSFRLRFRPTEAGTISPLHERKTASSPCTATASLRRVARMGEVRVPGRAIAASWVAFGRTPGCAIRT